MELTEWTDSTEGPLNTHLLIGAFQEPPALIIDRAPAANASTRYHGILNDVVVYLSVALGFTYEYVDVYAGPVNKSIGPSEVLIGLMMKGDFDLVARMISLTAERLALIDFPIPLIISPVVLLQSFPRIKFEYNAIFQPFQQIVWTALFIAFLLTVAFLTLTVVVSRSNSTRKPITKIAGDMFMYIFSVFASQGGETGYRWVSTCLVAGSWCLAAVVIVNGYNSQLTSFLSVRSYEPIVDSWEDLPKAHHLKFITEKNSLYEDLVLKSDSKHMIQLAEYLRRNPSNRFSTFEEFRSLIKGEMFVQPYLKLPSQMRVFNAMKLNKKECTLTFGNPARTHILLQSFAMRKGRKWNRAINNALLLMTDTGLIERLTKDYVGNIDRCTRARLTGNVGAGGQLGSLKLSAFHVLFIMLAIGYGLAFLAFLAELAVGLNKRRANCVNTPGLQRLVIEELIARVN